MNTAIWQLGLTLISVGCLVAVMWETRRSRVIELRGDVDELAAAVEKIGRAQRTTRMRAVRAAAENSAPPELQGPAELAVAPIAETPAARKLALRHRAMRRFQ